MAVLTSAERSVAASVRLHCRRSRLVAPLLDRRRRHTVTHRSADRRGRCSLTAAQTQTARPRRQQHARPPHTAIIQRPRQQHATRAATGSHQQTTAERAGSSPSHHMSSLPASSPSVAACSFSLLLLLLSLSVCTHISVIFKLYACFSSSSLVAAFCDAFPTHLQQCRPVTAYVTTRGVARLMFAMRQHELCASYHEQWSSLPLQFENVRSNQQGMCEGRGGRSKSIENASKATPHNNAKRSPHYDCSRQQLVAFCHTVS